MQGVELSKVNKYYGSVRVISDLDLRFAQDEFVVLVGPSGCGKTTTLRMVAGLESISSGDLTIAGTRANELSPAERDIAMVFQNYALYPNMSVYENMAFGLRNRGVPKTDVDREIKRTAEVLGIQQLLSRKPRQLSGGQQQRVALGRCLVRHPKLFLFDEPLSNLDAKLRLEMRQELKRLKKRISATSIYVTHDQIEAMTLGDRVVVMSQGLVQQAGPPEEIYHRPLNVFVATFVGSPSMNLIEGTLTSQNGQFHFLAEGMDVTIPTHLADAVAGAPAGKVLLGIRPEHVMVTPGPAQGGQPIMGTVDLTELLGSEQLVQVQVSGHALTATRVDPFLSLLPGQVVALTFLEEHLHIFDPASGRSLTADSAARQQMAQARVADGEPRLRLLQ